MHAFASAIAERIGARTHGSLPPRPCHARGRLERGAVNITVSLILVISLLATVGVALSSADRMAEGGYDYIRQTQSLLLAEAAVEDATLHLDELQDWSTLTLPMQNFSPTHSVGRGIIWSDLRNEPGDPGGSKDTNGKLLIRGYGRFMNASLLKGIEALYYRPILEVPPAGGVVLCGQDILDSGNGNTSIDGYNHNLPPASCQGSGCNAVRNNLSPNVPGIAVENSKNGYGSGDDNCGDQDGEDEGSNSISVPKNLDGTPPISYQACQLQGPNGLCSRTRFLMQNVSRIPQIEQLTSWPSGKSSYGSVSAPKVIMVPRGKTLKLTGNLQGAGVLFVQGKLDQVGTFTWVGSIIVGPGGWLSLRGTANIFGSIISAGSSTETALLELKGNGSVAWAGDAAQIGPLNMPGMIVSWREFVEQAAR